MSGRVADLQIHPGHLELPAANQMRGRRSTAGAYPGEERIDGLLGGAGRAPHGGLDPFDLQPGSGRSGAGGSQRPRTDQGFGHRAAQRTHPQRHRADPLGAPGIGGLLDSTDHRLQQSQLMHTLIFSGRSGADR